VLPVTDTLGLQTILHELLQNPVFRKTTGKINANYIAQNKGASLKILDHIASLLQSLNSK
jgi:3-deoxy-D-manno-octulosonic-acid transferase